jgi:hypothetical protein
MIEDQLIPDVRTISVWYQNVVIMVLALLQLVTVHDVFYQKR